MSYSSSTETYLFLDIIDLLLHFLSNFLSSPRLNKYLILLEFRPWSINFSLSVTVFS